MSDRRIVVCHQSGLRRIVGILSGDVAPNQLPALLTGMVGGDLNSNHASLGRVEKRYVMYREFVPATDVDGA